MSSEVAVSGASPTVSASSVDEKNVAEAACPPRKLQEARSTRGDENTGQNSAHSSPNQSRPNQSRPDQSGLHQSGSSPSGGSQAGGGQAGGSQSEGNQGRARTSGSKNGSRSERVLYGALDLGTNNCRLLIVEPDGDGFKVRDSFSRIVRLGEGLEQSGALSEEAMDRTIAALKVCAGKIRRARVGRVRCIATEACRKASNGSAFVRRVVRETGLRFEIIDGQAEAELAALGCENLFASSTQAALVFDIGGGSTELTWLQRDGAGPLEIAHVASYPLGVVTLAERYAGPGEYEHGYEPILAECLTALREFSQKISDLDQVDEIQLIGTSGTVTTLAAVHMGLPRYDRQRVDGCIMQMSDMMAVIYDLRQKSRSELAANHCIGVQRADLVLAGCAVMDALYQVFPAERVSVADRGLREGMLMRMMRRDRRRSQYRARRRQKAKRHGA